MYRYGRFLIVVAGIAVGCAGPVNVEQERSGLMARDREWSQTTKDVDKFLSYYASNASVYPPGMPIATGSGPIRDAFTKMTSMPGFSLQWTAAKADISSSGELGYTTGAYQMTMNGATEKGKYLTEWKKQSDGQWKVAEDIFNADAAAPPTPGKHVMLPAARIVWGEAPPNLPPGGKMAVISGDPGKAEPFVIRAQLPAGYKIAPHWHPTDEHITVLSGTVALGMGEKFDQAALQDLPAGGFGVAPAGMRHFFMARTAATIQVHGMGPLAFIYVNAADDPSKQQK
jgi:ketosteroid isomerase-like protein